MRFSRFHSRELASQGRDRVLHAFTISPHPIFKEPDADAFTGLGLVRHPSPFKFVVTPRSESVKKIIVTEATEAEVELMEWN